MNLLFALLSVGMSINLVVVALMVIKLSNYCGCGFMKDYVKYICNNKKNTTKFPVGSHTSY